MNAAESKDLKFVPIEHLPGNAEAEYCHYIQFYLDNLSLYDAPLNTKARKIARAWLAFDVYSAAIFVVTINNAFLTILILAYPSLVLANTNR